MCAWALNSVFSVCHPRWMGYMQEHIAIMTPVYAIHGKWHIHNTYLHHNSSICHPWHICKSILLSLQYMSPTMSDMCARAYYHDSSMCHSQRVTYMQKHITTSPARATYIEWHVCKSTVPKTQVGNSLVNHPKGLQNPRSTLGESYWFMPLCKRHVCKSMLVRLQYMTHTASVMYARAQHLHCTQDSSNSSSVLADPYMSTKPKARPW